MSKKSFLQKFIPFNYVVTDYFSIKHIRYTFKDALNLAWIEANETSDEAYMSFNIEFYIFNVKIFDYMLSKNGKGYYKAISLKMKRLFNE